MQQLNDDMDELFREAANHYPLATEGENWDAVMNRLQQQANPGTISQPKRNFRWLWSLLLLPLLFIAYLLTRNNDSESSTTGRNAMPSTPAMINEAKKAAVLPADSGNTTEKMTTAGQNPHPKTADLSKETQQPAIASPKASQQQTVDSSKASQQSTIALALGSQHRAVASPKVSQPYTAVTAKALQRDTADRHTKTFKEGRSSNDADQGSRSFTNTTSGSNRNVQHAPARSEKTMLPSNNIKTYDKNQEQQTGHAYNSDSMQVAAGAVADTMEAAAKKESVSRAHKATASLPEKETLNKRDLLKEKKTGSSKWYIGFIASPDLSIVKWQKPGKTGYGLGVLVGYSLSKRFSLETGLLWDRKYYYSKGEYLDSKKIPASWNVQDIDGWCRMFEIPLQARYKFSIREKHSWYVNAGLSSYIMNRENYDYSYDSYGTIRKGNSVYDNETRNWFSIIHMGVGYEKQLGIGNIRIEPYMKLPATGLGWGGLPITSFGLNIGITKALGR